MIYQLQNYCAPSTWNNSTKNFANDVFPTPRRPTYHLSPSDWKSVLVMGTCLADEQRGPCGNGTWDAAFGFAGAYEYVNATMAAVNAFFVESSWGAMSIAWDIPPRVINSTDTCADGGDGRWHEQAMAGALAQGYDEGAYDFYVMLMPYCDAKDWAGTSGMKLRPTLSLSGTATRRTGRASACSGAAPITRARAPLPSLSLCLARAWPTTERRARSLGVLSPGTSSAAASASRGATASATATRSARSRARCA